MHAAFEDPMWMPPATQQAIGNVDSEGGRACCNFSPVPRLIAIATSGHNILVRCRTTILEGLQVLSGTLKPFGLRHRNPVFEGERRWIFLPHW